MISKLIREFLVGMIRVYQRALSPFLGAHCRFEPTCSAYLIEALRKCGIAKRLLLGAWRILRCNPFCKAGYDPVPDSGDRGAGGDTSPSDLLT